MSRTLKPIDGLAWAAFLAATTAGDEIFEDAAFDDMLAAGALREPLIAAHETLYKRVRETSFAVLRCSRHSWSQSSDIEWSGADCKSGERVESRGSHMFARLVMKEGLE